MPLRGLYTLQTSNCNSHNSTSHTIAGLFTKPAIFAWCFYLLTYLCHTLAHAQIYLCHTNSKHLFIMATIHSTDIVYATVSQRGKTLTSITLSGMTSIAQIITHIRSIVKDSIGIFTLSLRNSTQGWLQERNIILKPRPAATQLTLF